MFIAVQIPEGLRADADLKLLTEISQIQPCRVEGGGLQLISTNREMFWSHSMQIQLLGRRGMQLGMR
jgi:hypothetical protein